MRVVIWNADCESFQLDMAVVVFIMSCRSTIHISKYTHHFICFLTLDLFNSTVAKVRQVLPYYIAVSASRNSETLATAGIAAQLVKNPPAMREIRVPSLGLEDALEKGTATHSSILAWRIPWTVQSMVSQRVRHD